MYYGRFTFECTNRIRMQVRAKQLKCMDVIEGIAIKRTEEMQERENMLFFNKHVCHFVRKHFPILDQ